MPLLGWQASFIMAVPATGSRTGSQTAGLDVGQLWLLHSSCISTSNRHWQARHDIQRAALRLGYRALCAGGPSLFHKGPTPNLPLCGINQPGSYPQFLSKYSQLGRNRRAFKLGFTFGIKFEMLSKRW